MLSADFEARKRAESKALLSLARVFFVLGVLEIAYLVVVFVIALGTLGTYLVGEVEVEHNFPWMWLMFLASSQILYAFFVITALLRMRESFGEVEFFIRDATQYRWGTSLYIISIPFGIAYSLVDYGTQVDPLLSLVGGIIFEIMLLIAKLGIALSLWRMANSYGNGDLKIGSALYLVFGFIGSFILASALEKQAKKVMRRLPPPPVPPWL